VGGLFAYPDPDDSKVNGEDPYIAWEMMWVLRILRFILKAIEAYIFKYKHLYLFSYQLFILDCQQLINEDIRGLNLCRDLGTGIAL